MAQFFDDSFPHHVIWQAGEGLGADNVVHAAVNQFYHLSGEEPAFSGLIANRDNWFCIFYRLIDAGGWGEVPALCKRLGSGAALKLKGIDAKF